MIPIPYIKRKTREILLYSILGVHPYKILHDSDEQLINRLNTRLNEIFEKRFKEDTKFLNKKKITKEEFIDTALFHLRASIVAFIDGRLAESIIYIHSLWEILEKDKDITEKIKLNNKWSLNQIRNALSHRKSRLMKKEIEPHLLRIAFFAIKETISYFNLVDQN